MQPVVEVGVSISMATQLLDLKLALQKCPCSRVLKAGSFPKCIMSFKSVLIHGNVTPRITECTQLFQEES